MSKVKKNSGLFLGDTMSKKEEEYAAITKCSSNKGFGDKSGIIFRPGISGGRQGSSPQSLTAATPDRYMPF